jgi:hypothetical protein
MSPQNHVSPPKNRQRAFAIKAKASSFAEILQNLPDNVFIDQIDLTIDIDPKLVIEGKVYVL